jgi:hypothetical protein
MEKWEILLITEEKIQGEKVKRLKLRDNSDSASLTLEIIIETVSDCYYSH